MINEQVYIINGRPAAVRVIHQSAYLDPRAPRPYNMPPPHMIQYPPPLRIDAAQGIEVIEEYSAQVGDPVVIEEVVFRGEVVQVGEREKEVINEQQAILVSEGYASEDGKAWKPLPHIMMTIFKVGQLAIQTITKLKAKFHFAFPRHKVLKATSANTDYYLAFPFDRFDDWFLRLIWAKLVVEKREIDQYGDWGTEVSGMVYKKSQFLGEWQSRYVSVSRGVLQSRKLQGGSVSLQIKQTKEIWTRFQEIKGGLFLVVKLWYGIIKEEFAVPLKQSLRWMYHILALLRAS